VGVAQQMATLPSISRSRSITSINTELPMLLMIRDG